MVVIMVTHIINYINNGSNTINNQSSVAINWTNCGNCDLQFLYQFNKEFCQLAVAITTYNFIFYYF